MHSISNAIKCPNCLLVLKFPVILPCKHSICKHHVLQSDFVICNKCDGKHSVPKTGFLDNQALADLIDAQIDQLNFGPIHSRSTQSCLELELLLADFRDLLVDPGYYTNQVISERKNRVLIKSEELKMKIDEEAEQLMAKLDSFQSECNQNWSFPEFQEELGLSKEYVKTLETKMSTWKHSLDQLKVDEFNWKRIILDAGKEIKCLNQNIELTKKKLLMNEIENVDRSVSFFENIDIYPLFESSKFNSVIVPRSLWRPFYDLCQFDPNQRWTLLYRASLHGFRSRDFHSRCDKRPNTLCVVMTTDGYVFGGFTNAIWDDPDPNNPDSDIDRYKSDPNAFVYSFKNPVQKPIKMRVSRRNQDKAILCNNNLGPSFGFGDIYIRGESNLNQTSFSAINNTYILPESLGESIEQKHFLAGSFSFLVKEIEVFQRIQ